MRFIGKLLLTIALLALLALVILYVLLQTTWASGWISNWVNQNTNYQVSLGKIDHDWSAPDHLQLKDVIFGHKDQPPTLTAKQISAGLSARQLTEPGHFASLELEGGALNLSPAAATLPIEADVLQLRTMALQAQDDNWNLNGQQINGGIAPWRPEEGYLLGKHGHFQLSARSLRLNDVPASQVLVQGEINQNQLTLSNFGADVAQGQLTGSASRAEDGSWQIDNLRLSKVRLQTPRTMQEFWQPITALPSVAVSRFDLIDARIEGPGWAFIDLDVTLQNVTFKQDDWQSENGELSFNATDIVNGNMHLIDPIVNLNLSPNGVEIKQFTTRWEGGLLRTNGNWQRSDHRLQLNEFVVAGMEYTLPGDWLQRWQTALPNWLAEVNIKKFSANRNLLIDINPDFPFQLTALDGYGSDLLLARNHQWGVWGGSLNLNASDATFNKVDVRRPSLALTANDSQISLTDLSAFTQDGLLEAKATIGQTPSRAFSITMNGRSVPADILTRWGWPAQVSAASGNANLQLQLNGQLAANTPLKPTLNGALHGVGPDGQPIRQHIQQGAVTETSQ
ncbi:AsmA family protein [Brenneria goodwinii]|uniref:FIG01200701: possible membrane protein n=1 Tax=Brenneria goodwinii TaxID=1109412 RepID=A0A0G4JSY9_9GAMM|nr:AsmA family protein [Brenneria goodwinii]CPR15354.1 FIG01200701: possible membrane protein [Brenneria goodwinii]